jgi:hypothetical protein
MNAAATPHAIQRKITTCLLQEMKAGDCGNRARAKTAECDEASIGQDEVCLWLDVPNW